MPPPPSTKKKKTTAGGGAEGGTGTRGRARRGRSEADGSHIHTLGVETGHKRVLKVARMSKELLGSGARRRFYKEK